MLENILPGVFNAEKVWAFVRTGRPEIHVPGISISRLSLLHPRGNNHHVHLLLSPVQLSSYPVTIAAPASWNLWLRQHRSSLGFDTRVQLRICLGIEGQRQFSIYGKDAAWPKPNYTVN